MSEREATRGTALGRWMDTVWLALGILLLSMLWFLPKMGGLWRSLLLAVPFTVASLCAVYLYRRRKRRKTALIEQKRAYARYWLESLIWVPEASALESCLDRVATRRDVSDREAVPGGMLARIDGRRAYVAILQRHSISPPDERDVVEACKNARRSDARCAILFGTVAFSAKARDAARAMDIPVSLVGPQRMAGWIDEDMVAPDIEPPTTGWQRLRSTALLPQRRNRYLFTCLFLIFLYLVIGTWYLLPPAFVSLLLAMLAREIPEPDWP